MRQTRIIATLGPSSATDERVLALARAGVDIFRLNFSHGSHDEHAESFARVRRAAEQVQRTLAVLQDLSGPKIRTGRLPDGGAPMRLVRGERLAVVTGDEVGRDGVVFTTFEGLAQASEPGMRLLLDDGKLELKVLGTDGTRVETEVIVGGMLGEHKGINAPDVALPSAALTEKDRIDLRFGVELGADLVALSFVQRPQDLRDARALLAELQSAAVLVAKIERPQALTNLDAILVECDGVMVARGDLGNEVPLESVPRIQKEITRRAQAVGIPVIVATQVLESMRTAPRPTRAEVSDAANAVDDSVDAIMLSGETAAGDYPVEAVRILDAVIRDVESMHDTPQPVVDRSALNVPHNRAVCEAALTLAASANADAIVAVTRDGMTARMLSSLRPFVPVHAITPNEATARRLLLRRGLEPHAVDPEFLGDPSGRAVERHLVERGVLQAGETIVFVSVNADLTRFDANFLRIRRVGDRGQ